MRMNRTEYICGYCVCTQLRNVAVVRRSVLKGGLIIPKANVVIRLATFVCLIEANVFLYVNTAKVEEPSLLTFTRS